MSRNESNISLLFSDWYILHHSARARSLLNLEREKSRKFLIVIMLSLSDFNERFDSKITRKWSELKGVVVTL